MDEPASMDVFEGKAYLDEPIENLCFAKELIVFYLALDMITKVSNFAVFHNYYQLF